jgi:hypothetical protein
MCTDRTCFEHSMAMRLGFPLPFSPAGLDILDVATDVYSGFFISFRSRQRFETSYSVNPRIATPASPQQDESHDPESHVNKQSVNMLKHFIQRGMFKGRSDDTACGILR